jgi:IS605 OrfB family transposase
MTQTTKKTKEKEENKDVASYSFYSKDLNKGKYNLFVEKAKAIRTYKNALSLEISSNLLHYLELSKIDFIKLFGTQQNKLNPSSLMRGNEVQKAAIDVFDCYQNKNTCIKQKIKFFIQNGIEVEYYKKNTKKNKKGDIKSFEIKTKNTPLTKTLTFLARYGDENTLEYVEKKIEDDNDDKKAFFTTLKELIEKFGLERLMKLAHAKRDRILNVYGDSIAFTSLSFRSAVQSETPLIQNSHNKTFCNGMIYIPGFCEKKMYVPTSFNINHQGHLNQYKSKEYIVCIDEKRKKVRFITTKKVNPVISPESENYLGVDTNIKHNLFCTSENSEIDLDRDLFKGYVAFLKKHQEKKEHSKGEEQQYDLWQERISCMLKKKARELVNHAIKEGKDHIIMEDLSSFAKSFVKSEEFEGFKYSRITRLLSLSSLNKIVKGICKKLGLRLTLIPSHYTSQWCFHCGHIEKANRPNQETFSCACCGHTANADHHSSQAIKIIGSSDVLKNSMLMRDKSSDWIPKVFKKDFIRKQLEDITPKLAFQLDEQKLII